MVQKINKSLTTIEIIEELDNLFSNNIPEIEKAMSTENRMEMLKIIRLSKKTLNITELSKKMNLSYKNTFFNVKRLEKVKLIKLKKEQKSSGQQVIITYTGEDIIKKLAYINGHIINKIEEIKELNDLKFKL